MRTSIREYAIVCSVCENHELFQVLGPKVREGVLSEDV